MDDNLFDQLVSSVEHAGAIRREERVASREFEYCAVDVKAIREATGRTQESFAQMIGASVSAVRSWEQGKRHPVGPARVLLAMFNADPKAADELLHQATG